MFYSPRVAMLLRLIITLLERAPLIDPSILIRDVSESLKKLLRNSIDELSGENEITLNSPADIELSPNQSGLSLFLYTIQENPHMKNRQFVQIDPDTSQHPPLALDLYYLLTPYSSSSNSSRQVEQIILTKVMSTFYDNSTLDSFMLTDNLVESGNNELRVVLNALSLEQLNQMWGMFRNSSYRLCISYVVTPLQIPSIRTESARRVISKQIDKYLKDGGNRLVQ
jgi:hypothetical protein